MEENANPSVFGAQGGIDPDRGPNPVFVIQEKRITEFAWSRRRF
jgi:hypothetical protein